jgi:hypothetical protein
MPVRRILALSTIACGHGRIGSGVDGVADAVEVGEHRHARIGNRATRLLPPRGTIMSIQPGGGEHRAHGGAILRRQSCTPSAGTRLRPAGHERLMDRAVGMDRLAPAAQQRGIARSHAERGRRRRHVGAAFIDDADQPDRHAHAFEHQPVGARLRHR